MHTAAKMPKTLAGVGVGGREGKGDIVTGFTAARDKDPAGGGLIAAAAPGAWPSWSTLGGKHKLFFFLTRLLPNRLQVELVGKLYAS